MKQNKFMFVIALVLVASMVMAACAPTEVIKTVVVEKTVQVDKTVEVEVIKTEIVEVERGAFTTPHPILSDLRVRQAIAHCTDKTAIAQAGYPLVTPEQAQALTMNTFIPAANTKFYAGDANITIYAYDPAKGGTLLDEAGWTLADGATYRNNAAGEELSLKFTTTTAAFRQAWAAVFEQQMAACGIRIIRLHAPSSWWFGDTTGLARRDFELGAYAWVGQADPGGYTLWACDQIPMPGNNWLGQNYMGWCNEAADKNIKIAVNSLDEAARIEAYKVVQQEYTKDVPAIPVFNRTETFAASTNLVGFAPTPGEEYYTYNVQKWTLADGGDTIVIGFTQPPASMYTTVETGYSAVLAVSLVDFPRGHTTLNYNFAPYLTETFSTLDNGLALNNDVTVKPGDVAIDAAGNVVTLEAGMKVIDAATGTEVELTDAGVAAKQLVVTYKWRNDLVFSDGVPLTIEDFKLAYKIACDRENGATTFYTCDRTLDVTFAEDGTNTYTVTFVPGYQDPFYYTAPYGYLPAHRVIESEGAYKGMTLADVPAKDYLTLPEIAERPMGVGPYMITDYVLGESITYAANPYAPADLKAATPNLIIKMITAENAEAQLLAGEVDLLDSTTLAGLTEQLVAAEAAGQIKNFVIAGATWEHIDFNLFVR
jgi:ABC-type transport system substrate-binding protein